MIKIKNSKIVEFGQTIKLVGDLVVDDDCLKFDEILFSAPNQYIKIEKITRSPNFNGVMIYEADRYGEFVVNLLRYNIEDNFGGCIGEIEYTIDKGILLEVLENQINNNWNDPVNYKHIKYRRK